MSEYKTLDEAYFAEQKLIAACHKYAGQMYQDVQLVFFGEVRHERPEGLLDTLHSIGKTLDLIPQFAQATDLRLRTQLLVNKANAS